MGLSHPVVDTVLNILRHVGAGNLQGVMGTAGSCRVVVHRVDMIGDSQCRVGVVGCDSHHEEEVVAGCTPVAVHSSQGLKDSDWLK